MIRIIYFRQIHFLTPVSQISQNRMTQNTTHLTFKSEPHFERKKPYSVGNPELTQSPYTTIVTMRGHTYGLS